METNEYYDICPACGASFLRISNSQKYCSVICRKAKQKERETGVPATRIIKKSTLNRDIKRADALGISYGYYMALYGG